MKRVSAGLLKWGLDGVTYTGNLMVRRRFFSAVSNHGCAAILRDARKSALLQR
jgi:hypothetical protein